jgi:hypothetical protein
MNRYNTGALTTETHLALVESAERGIVAAA